METTTKMVEKFWIGCMYRLNNDGELTTLGLVAKTKKAYKATYQHCGVSLSRIFGTEQEARWFIESYYAVVA